MIYYENILLDDLLSATEKYFDHTVKNVKCVTMMMIVVGDKLDVTFDFVQIFSLTVSFNITLMN